MASKAPKTARSGIVRGLKRVLASPVARKGVAVALLALAALIGVEVSPETRAALDSILAVLSIAVAA